MSALGRTALRAACSTASFTSSGLGSKRSICCDDHARLVTVLVVDPPAHQHDRVGDGCVLTGRQRLAEDQQLDRALEVIERREHHRVALLRADPLGLGDHPADRDPLAVAPVESSASEQSTLREQRGADVLQRMSGDEQPERLLLRRQQLGAVELDRRDRGVARACYATAAAVSPSSRSKIDPWPISASCCAFCPAPWACSSTASIPLRVAPVDPNAPHLISASIAFLLTARPSTRAQKS